MDNNKINSAILCIMFILGWAASCPVSANSGLTGVIPIVSGETPSLVTPSAPIQVKRGEKYDEANDPALRRGTENEEMPQSSFFAIPAAVIGIIGLVLFFTRDKE